MNCEEKDTNILEYKHNQFWCRIYTAENDGRKICVEASLMGVDCDYTMLCYARACCQTYIHYQADFPNIKTISNKNGEILEFEIRRKNNIMFLKIIAAKRPDSRPAAIPSPADPGFLPGEVHDAYFDHQDAIMLSSVISTCLDSMLPR